MITKNVRPDEVGKIFSIVGTFQSLMPFAASPLFGFLYRGTVATFPAAFLFLVAGLKLIEAIVVLVVFVGVKRDDKERQDEMKEKHEMPPLLPQTNAQTSQDSGAATAAADGKTEKVAWIACKMLRWKKNKRITSFVSVSWQLCPVLPLLAEK